MNFYALTAAIPAGYQFAAIAACLKRLASSSKQLTNFTPPVSILKPVRGADSGFYQAILSQAEVDYPEYEMLFGVGDDNDPALAVIGRLQAEFPDKNVRIIRTSTLAPNAKAGALIDLAREARHAFLVISDADIRVPRDYLLKVIAPLEDLRVGLVTCLYRAGSDTFAGSFEGLGVETDFAPSALVAPLAGVDEFAFGSTIAVRRADLARGGGFEAVAEYIADDYQIGKCIRGLGLRCVLADTVVDTHLGAANFSEAWRHQIRWARTVRVSRPGGFAGLFVTFATFWALLLALCGQWQLALGLLAIRLTTAAVAGIAVMRSSQSARLLWLVPLRDLWAVLVWVAGLMPGPVEWQGRRMVLSVDGRILPDPQGPPPGFQCPPRN